MLGYRQKLTFRLFNILTRKAENTKLLNLILIHHKMLHPRKRVTQI